MIAILAAAACVAISDGQGATTVTCPDGRTGYLHTDAGGATSGMLGAEPYQPPTTEVRPSPLPGMQAGLVTPPAATPPPAGVTAQPDPPPPVLPSLSPPAGPNN